MLYGQFQCKTSKTTILCCVANFPQKNLKVEIVQFIESNRDSFKSNKPCNFGLTKNDFRDSIYPQRELIGILTIHYGIYQYNASSINKP